MLPQNFARAAKLRLRDLFAATAWAGSGNIEISWINIGLGGGEWLRSAQRARSVANSGHIGTSPVTHPPKSPNPFFRFKISLYYSRHP
jgi:hypothetical protein